MPATPSTPRFVLLAAIDDSPVADLVIAQAAATSRATPGTEIHLLHASGGVLVSPITPPTFEIVEGRRYLDEALAKMKAASGARVIGHLLVRDPASAILQVAASIDADLIVVGPHHHRGPAQWLLGSVAQKVAQRASCAVLVARAKAHADDGIRAPEIEPPCPECLRAQADSGGRQLWCARHSEHHPRAHLHYELPEGFGGGSSLIGGGEG